MNGKLVGYVCVGTNDLERAKGFYNELFEDLNVNEALAISGSILLLSLALVGLAFRNKLVKAGDNEE